MLDPCWLIVGCQEISTRLPGGTRASGPIESFSADGRGVVGALLPMLLGALLFAGCGGRGTEPGVPEGRYTAFVQGAVTDTLRGAAHARHRDSMLVGLELGGEGGPGLSIELDPLPPALRTYDVVDAETFQIDGDDTSPEGLALLQLDEANFEAVGGTIEFAYVSEEQVGATFTFQMDGAFNEGGGDDVSVEVTGELNAPPLQ
jgi:hypothetical protein